MICQTKKVAKCLCRLVQKVSFGSRTKAYATVGSAIKAVAPIPPRFTVSPEDSQASLLGLLAKIKV